MIHRAKAGGRIDTGSIACLAGLFFSYDDNFVALLLVVPEVSVSAVVVSSDDPSLLMAITEMV
jgi:hypothetical protein